MNELDECSVVGCVRPAVCYSQLGHTCMECGVGPRPGLSPEAREARRPIPPHILMDARQDNIELKPGRGRAVKAVRSKRPEGETE